MNAINATAHECIRAVAKATGARIKDLKGRSRTQPLARWRQIAMYLVRDNTDLSYNSIGQLFNRDHSTVVHSVELVASCVEFGYIRPVIGPDQVTTADTVAAAQKELTFIVAARVSGN